MTEASVSFADNLTDSPRSATPRPASPGQVPEGRLREQEPSFFTVIIWRDQAKHAVESLSKGSQIVVVGRLQQRTWRAEDGSTRSVMEVVADELGPSLRWMTATDGQGDARVVAGSTEVAERVARPKRPQTSWAENAPYGNFAAQKAPVVLVKKPHGQGKNLADPHSDSNTKKELLKLARQLGVVGRDRMTKAELAEAIRRKQQLDVSAATSSASQSSLPAQAHGEAQSAASQIREAVWKAANEEVQSATQQARDAVWKTVQGEMQSATQQMQAAMRGIAQPAARQVRDTLQAVVRQEVQSAAQQVRGTLQAVVRQEMQAAAPQVRGTVQSIVRQEMQAAAPQVREAVQADVGQETQSPEHDMDDADHTTEEDLDPLTLKPLRASRHEPQSWLRRLAGGVGKTFLVPIILALATSILTSQFVSSRVVDRALLGSTDPIATKLFYDRDNGVQGLTWALPGTLGNLSSDEANLVAQAGGRVNEFNDWIRARGGVDVNASFIKLIVTGQRQAGVVITDMQAKIDKCTAPLTGTLLYGPPEGEKENTQIAFDLDENPSVAREVDPKKSLGDPDYLGNDYFKNRNIPLTLGEDQIFSIVGVTSTNYCTWYIDIELFVSDHTEHIQIGYRPDGNKKQEPLKITAIANFRPGDRQIFAAYNDLFIMQRQTNPAGFTTADPQSYVP